MTNATFTTNPNAIPEQAYDMLGEAKATRLDGDGFFKDMYEVASGDRRVVVILDTNCVRWMAYAKGYRRCGVSAPRLAEGVKRLLSV